MLREEKVALCFVCQLKPFPEVRTNRVESIKTWRWKVPLLNNEIHSFRSRIPFYPWVCLHHTSAVRNLILRCLTGFHMAILSKSNYRVRLNVNIDIADSISFYFNFGKGHHFVLRLKQHIFPILQGMATFNVGPQVKFWWIIPNQPDGL